MSLYNKVGGEKMCPGTRDHQKEQPQRKVEYAANFSRYRWEHVPELFRRFDGNGLFRIWPPEPRSILWPPFNILGDPQVNALANILTQSGAFNQSFNPNADWTFTI